jgi:hypothetical protein
MMEKEGWKMEEEGLYNYPEALVGPQTESPRSVMSGSILLFASKHRPEGIYRL